jgi:hypothetical protein
VRLVTADPPTLAVLVQGRGAVKELPMPSWPYFVVTLALDAGVSPAGQCGDSALTGTRCRFRLGGRLVCEPPPPIRSCVGAPDPLVCDVRNCASAQEHFFDGNGYAYYSGDCLGLPGFVPSSPDLVFSTVGNSTDFVVVGSDAMGRSCTWTSNPAFGDGFLQCAD